MFRIKHVQWFYFFLHIFFFFVVSSGVLTFWTPVMTPGSHYLTVSGVCVLSWISVISPLLGPLSWLFTHFPTYLELLPLKHFFFFNIICGSFSSSISFKFVSSFGLRLCACVLTWEIPASLLTLSYSLHLSRKRICYQSLQARGRESAREPRCLECSEWLPTWKIICASVLVKSRRWLVGPGFYSSEWECFCLAWCGRLHGIPEAPYCFLMIRLGYD